MDGGCPFTALHNALNADKKGSLSGSNGNGSTPLACPFSGRKAMLAQHHKSSEDHEEQRSRSTSPTRGGDWGHSHSHLNVIRETETEHEENDDFDARSVKSINFNDSFGAHKSAAGHSHAGRSLAGSSLKALSKIGSKASGLGHLRGAASRMESSHAKSKISSNARRHKKRHSGSFKDTIQTQAPPYVPTEWARYSPLVKSSWAHVLKTIPWDELGVKLYDSIFEAAPSLESMFSKSAVAMGIKMVDMIDTIVNSIGDMSAVHTRMESLGGVHHRNSVHAYEHMPTFYAVINSLLEKVLDDMYTSEVRAAWVWFWEWLTESMNVVEEVYNSKASLIHQSWEIATSKMSREMIGDSIYETLFGVAPNLRTLFTKPKEIMTLKLVNIVGMLVSLSDHPETVDDIICDLGKRHVTYGVASHHIPVMKQALLAILEKICGDAWDPPTARAWQELWDKCCKAMMTAIDNGRDYGSAIEAIWEKVDAKTSQKKFATLVYSRLTSASPELILVFKQAALGRKKDTSEEGEEGGAPSREESLTQDAASHSVAVGGKSFGSATDDLGSRPPSVASSADGGAAGSSAGGNGHAGQLQSHTSFLARGRRFSTTSQSSGSGFFDSGAVRQKRKSSFQLLIDAVENMTGLDIDGDGLVGGDIKETDDDSRGAKQYRLAWGMEIWDLLCCCVDLLYEPELQKQRLTVIATRFFQHGCRASHLRTVGTCLQGVIAELLIVTAKQPWGTTEAAAWDWFWAGIEGAMRRTMEAHEKGMAETVRGDWKHIQAVMPEEEFGNLFYQEIHAAAPDLLSLFVRPKRLQYNTFVELMKMLVQFSADPEEFFVQVKPLAIRHMKYGVKADDVERFDRVLRSVLSKALGDRYTPSSQSAWNYVWNSVSRCVSDCLNIGSSLVTVALVTGEVEELERALTLAPRGQRADWITRVQIHDSVISPLYWAIRDGKADMARVMIRDLLTLRADRDSFYFGYDQLWALHPDIITVLCKICPNLLEDLFDGMLWHSATVEEDDTIRVNYYIRELYADPEKHADAWGSPFGMLARQGPSTIFVHPVVKKVLEVKWRQFGRTYFLLMELWFTLILALFLAAFVCYEDGQCERSLRMGVGGLAVLTLAGQLLLIVGQARAGQVGKVKLGFATVMMPRWLHTRWNWLRMISMMMLAVLGLLGPCDKQLTDDPHAAAGNASSLAEGAAAHHRAGHHVTGVNGRGEFAPSGADIATGIVAVLMWVGTFQLFTVSDQLSAFAFSVGTLISDVSRVLIVLVVLIVSFGTALARLESGGAAHFDSVDVSMLTLIRHMLWLDPPEAEEMELQPLSMFCFVSFRLLSSIGLLNILVAQLSQTCSNMSRQTESYAIVYRMRITIDIESSLSLGLRKKYWEQLKLFEPLEFEKGYLGPAGGIQCFEHSSVALHPKYLPDRVVRVRGEASPMLPWPVEIPPDDDSGGRLRGGDSDAEGDASDADSVGPAAAD